MSVAQRIPLATTTELRRPLLVTRTARIGLALAAFAVLAAALAVALKGGGRPPALVSRGSDGVIVLDVSGSIGPREYRRLAGALSDAVSSGRRYGLVVFSDVAYEVFPPGTDPAQVIAVRRFFVARKKGESRLGTMRVLDSFYLGSPWTGAFTGGTRISEGLKVARQVIERDRIPNGAVVLMSDLNYDSFDVGAIEREMFAYSRKHLSLRIIGLSPARSRQVFFDRLRELPGIQAVNTTATLGSGSLAAERQPPPFALVGLGLALLGLLAVNELALARLMWAPTQARGAAA